MATTCRRCDGELHTGVCLRCLYDETPVIAGVELLDVLGRGGMGTVYRGRLATGGFVAVKVMNENEPELRERFAREARLLARLSHPGIVALHAWSADPPHLVMELVEGTPLGRCAPARACALVGELCDAIAAMHRAGIVHRDLKPSNVLVCGGRVKLIDFGIAAHVQSTSPLTRIGQRIGTPEYMAPEALAGEHANPAMDIYGLARLLRTITSRLPGHVERVVERALDDDPRARPTIEELRAALLHRPRNRIAVAACIASVAVAHLTSSTSLAAVTLEPPSLERTLRPSGRLAMYLEVPPEPAARKRASARHAPDDVLAPQANGALVVRVSPWALLSIDGAPARAIEPPVERIELPAGRHVVVLTNPASRRSDRRVVEVSPDSVATLVVDLNARQP